MASSSPYYSNDEDVLRREAAAEISCLNKVPLDGFEAVYEIERCTNYIKQNRCKKVALQFPDSLLIDASTVAWRLEKNCDAKIYILADTSYGHCDVDEVNAKHVDADLIIHYGESSLTQSATIPTLFVFGRHPSPLQIEDVKKVFRDTFPAKESTRIVFLHHVMCHYIADDISDSMMSEYPYLSVGRLNIPTDPGGAKLQENKESNDILKDLCTKSCPGCSCRLENTTDEKSEDKINQSTNTNVNETDVVSSVNSPSDISKDLKNEEDPHGDVDMKTVEIQSVNGSSNEISDETKMVVDNSHLPDCKDYITGFYTIPLETDKLLSDYAIFYLGPKDAESLRNLMLSHPSCDVHAYDPTTGYEKLQSRVNKQLMKRYYLIEKAKDAKIVGILVGTMGVAGYLECLNYLKKVAKAAKKKTYTFIMGKLTPEKLANYLEIDIYVLVANPEHSIFDSSNFYRPVVTPYEFDVACNPNRQWTNGYITDFRRILPGGPEYVELPSSEADRGDETTMSLITGGIRADADIEDDVAMSSDVALRNEKTDLAIFGTDSSETLWSEVMVDNDNRVLGAFDTGGLVHQDRVIAHRMSGRTWKGLEQKLGETPVTKATKGRSGLPVSYNEGIDF